ncbi:MAG: relaxase/mobilization nuclease domain-containing protein [Acidobacteriota bacterium]
MAIAKQASAASAGDVAGYLVHGRRGHEVDPETRVDWTSARNLPTDDPELAAKIMDATAELGDVRVEQPMYHFSVSFHVEDAPLLDQDRMEAIADRILHDLELADRQVLIVAHKDREHPHFHVLANRIHENTGKAWDRWQDRVRMQTCLRHLELEHGLRQVRGYLYGERPEPERTVTSREVRQAAQDGKPPLVEQLRGLGVAEDLKEATSWADLEARLARHGLVLQAAGRGLQIYDGQTTAKPSSLHRGSSLPRLEARFGESWHGYRDRTADGGPSDGRSPKTRGKRVAPNEHAVQRGLPGLQEALQRLREHEQIRDQLKAMRPSHHDPRLQNSRDAQRELDRLERLNRTGGEVSDAYLYHYEVRDKLSAAPDLTQALEQIQKDPAAYGKLPGGLFDRKGREQAVERIRQAARRAIERQREIQHLRDLVPRLKATEAARRQLSDRQTELGSREALMDALRQRAYRMPHRSLPQLSADDREVLGKLQRYDAGRLSPLSAALHQLQRVAPGAKGERQRLEKEIWKLVAGRGRGGRLPKTLLYRLAPPWVKLAVSVHSKVQKLLRDQDYGMER